MTHLHVHTKYSLLDGMIKIEELAQKLVALNQKAVAITEHGNLYSSVEAYKVLSEFGIKTITGCEVYICDDVNVKDKNSKYYHLILLCKNEIGRLNLQKLVSQSSIYKYYGKPRIDFEMLKEHSDGLICLSACMAGEISRALMDGDTSLAEHIATKYKALFGDDYYIEYQAHSNAEQQKLNLQLVELAESLNIKYVVTCDAHYLNKEDKKYHDIFVQIGTVREAGEIYDDCYIQSEQEVLNNCKSTQQYNDKAIKNTQEITDKCTNTIPLSAPIIPHVDIPTKFKSEVDYLKYLCNEGLKKKGFMKWTLEEWDNYLTETVEENGKTVKRKMVEYNSLQEIKNIYRQRANYEMHYISKMGFEGYYLLVHSYVSTVRRRGIARGSGGGSLIAYLCGIVDIDPIKYGLYFERFIDVGALGLLEQGLITKKQLKIPDFDCDFSPSDRAKVVQAIVDKYGQENVVSLGQFSYLKAKGAIKDIGKVLGIPFDERNEITSQIRDETLEQALDLGLLDSYKDKYPELFDYCLHLQGLPKSFGVHPCGKCICMKNADYYNATEYSPEKDEWVLQGDMHTADDLGLVKIDLLGLRTLDVIYDVLDMIGKDYDYIAPHKINFNDKEVWNEFALGHTDCIFQFEGQGMKQMLKDMKCDSIENLSAANALYRPGSKDYIPNYVNRKNGIEPITYLHPDLEPILSKTYGIIVFQEQLIEIGRFAKLSNPDELRKATAKKKQKLMDKIEPELKSGLINRGWTQQQADTLWTDILKFAKYSFNKSHSIAYAITAYIIMFLKIHHTVEFFTANINSYVGDIKQVVKTINEGKRMGVEFKFDNWRNVKSKTSCRDGIIYLGIDTIKGCGDTVATALNEVGKQKPNTFIDVLKLLSDNPNINNKQIETLIVHDFFNEYGLNGKLLKIFELYEALNGRKVFRKDSLPNTIDCRTLKLFSTETEKQFRNIQTDELLEYLCSQIEDKLLSVKTILDRELQDFGYITYKINTKGNYGYVTDIDTRYGSPKISLYNLKSGKEVVYKILKNKYQDNPINKGNIIQYCVCQKLKSKMINGKWCKLVNQYETWIDKYTVRS